MADQIGPDSRRDKQKNEYKDAVTSSVYGVDVYVFVGLALCRERQFSYSLITQTDSHGKQLNVWVIAENPSLELLAPHASHTNLSGFPKLNLRQRCVKACAADDGGNLRVCCVANVHKATAAVNRIEQEKTVCRTMPDYFEMPKAENIAKTPRLTLIASSNKRSGHVCLHICILPWWGRCV